MAGGLVTDIAVRIIATVEIVVKILVVFVFSTEDAIAVTVVIFVIFVEVFPHIVAVAEALNNHAVAFGTAFKLTTPTCTNK